MQTPQQAIEVDGSSAEELKCLIAYAEHDSAGDPAVEPILKTRVYQFALRREDAMPATSWRDTKHASLYCRGAGTGPFLYAGYVLKPGRLIGVGLHREWNAATFTERDRAISDLLIQHFGPELLLPEAEATLTTRVQDLPPQLRRVLGLLLEAHTAKRIARALDLSTYTVNDHIKRLYRRLNVESRAELLALFLPSHGASTEGLRAWHALLRDSSFLELSVKRAAPESRCGIPQF